MNEQASHTAQNPGTHERLFARPGKDFRINLIDMRKCLESWPYDAENNVRIERGVDGREIILVRLPMGLEQYEINGRPDGRRMHGMDSALDFHQARSHAEQKSPSAMVLDLTADERAELLQEAEAYLHRLNVFFRIKDWTRAERDAAHVLRLLEFVKLHSHCIESRGQFDSWQPHILRIHLVARAMILLDRRQYRDAFQTARDIIGISGNVDGDVPDYGMLAEALLESVRVSLAAPILHRREESSFLRQDDYWTIRYEGQTAFLKATRGLHCLACLLRFPKREFHVSALIATLLESPIAASEAATNGGVTEKGDPFCAGGLNDGIPILDAHAKLEYKRRLNELREDLKEAQRFNDPDRSAKARDEINAIAHQLASAVGLGGRDRKTSSEAERARCAVAKRIKQAIQRIGESIPALGQHLSASIKTGYFCSYNPDPDRLVHWQF